MTNCSLQCRFIKKKNRTSHATLHALVEWAVYVIAWLIVKTMTQHVVRMKTHRSLAKYFRNYLYLLLTSSEDK